MRRWLVIFLIVLMPWRAWAGDAMTLVAPSTPAPMAHCADHAMAPASAHADHGSDHAPSEDRVVPHAVCDICNGPALAAPVPFMEMPAPLPHARQSTGPVRFASALPHAGHKPPIA